MFSVAHEGYMKSPNKAFVHTSTNKFAGMPIGDYRKCIGRASKSALIGVAFLFASNVQAQADINPLKPLKSVPVPGPSDAALMEVVKDKAAAIQLGKALFWDPRVGSDNKTACATCHFGAGADSRGKNQVSPGLLSDSHRFDLGGAPNYVLTARDFPLTSFNPRVE
jgi:hypothetical protein